MSACASDRYNRRRDCAGQEKGDRKMESYMQMLTDCAKKAAVEAAKMGTADKNRGLLAVADELTAQQDMILEENAKDLEAAKEKGIKQSLIDRLAARLPVR